MLVQPNRVILAANEAFNNRFGSGADSTGQSCYSLTHRLPEPCEYCGERCPIKRPGEPQIHRHGLAEDHDFDKSVATPVRGDRGDVVAFLVVSQPANLGAT